MTPAHHYVAIDHSLASLLVKRRADQEPLRRPWGGACRRPPQLFRNANSVDHTGKHSRRRFCC